MYTVAMDSGPAEVGGEEVSLAGLTHHHHHRDRDATYLTVEALVQAFVKNLKQL